MATSRSAPAAMQLPPSKAVQEVSNHAIFSPGFN